MTNGEQPAEHNPEPVLGHDDRQIVLTGIDDNRDTMIGMLRQARREVLFCSLVLDPQLLNNNEAIEALRSIIVNHRNFRMRVVVYNAGMLARSGHRLLEFGRSKPSFFSFKVPAPEHAQFDQTLFLVDGVGFIHRPKQDMWRGVANFNDEAQVSHHRGTFESLWSSGEADQDLRQFRM